MRNGEVIGHIGVIHPSLEKKLGLDPGHHVRAGIEQADRSLPRCRLLPRFLAFQPTVVISPWW
ncbi:hypothetical protein ACLK16_09120 [Escherichia coli]